MQVHEPQLIHLPSLVFDLNSRGKRRVDSAPLHGTDIFLPCGGNASVASWCTLILVSVQGSQLRGDFRMAKDECRYDPQGRAPHCAIGGQIIN